MVDKNTQRVQWCRASKASCNQNNGGIVMMTAESCFMEAPIEY